MDFTGQYQFAGTGQAYHHPQFMPIPPLTPSHSHSAGSDEYNASPPEGFESVPHDQFHNFDYSQAFPGPQQASRLHRPPGPPTPPNQSAFAASLSGQQRLNDGINGHANGAGRTQSHGDAGLFKAEAEDMANGRGASEEDDSNMTPAQSKRKAQNRAAQRAFRERKEKHVKDLEAKLADLEAAQARSSAENERLRRDLQKISTENEILKATSNTGHNNSQSPEPMMTGPMRYSPNDFASNILEGHTNKSFSHRIVHLDGNRLLAAGASWDFIISHDLFKRGLVDVGNVSQVLKNRAKCDGQGPVFMEKDILEAIEISVASGTDDLL
ncbi:hypothetical protein N3K66_000193 [Trichothecium roseum]|uniref:Uncharacterized protein n=1 Tax=Trichothecium roseum TaxID=47278 RepID=A0ACC0VBI1_9HYPO|nr:hypothetical protein N3K66_000193 [Trichothecium roseum]